MRKSNQIYLDYAASAAPNPSSIHALGLKEKESLQKARAEVATVLSCRPSEIIFTSSGTEGNNLAIQGTIYAVARQGFFRSSDLRVPILARPFKNLAWLPHIVTTNIEHPSVLKTCKLLQDRGLAEISIVPVETNGIVDPKKIRKAIKKNTVLVSVMYGNNEIGSIQPIKEIAKEIRHYKKTRPENFSRVLGSPGFRPRLDRSKNFPASFFPLFHTDAVQAVNYLDLNVERLGVDLLTLSGSKIENSGRVGALYKKKSVPLLPIMGGGDQEGGLRPGTENLPEILKFSAALAGAQKIKEKESTRLIKLRDYFFKKLAGVSFLEWSGRGRGLGKPRTREKGNSGEFIINGDLHNRLPNNVNITVPNIPSDLLVIELSARGVMASAKSACEAEDGKASYVIKAINKNIKDTDGSIRFSFGRNTTKPGIDYTVKALSEILRKLKKWYN